MKKWLSSTAPQFVESFLCDLNTPRSLAVWIAFKNGCWRYLSELQVEASHYPEGVFNALRFRLDLQATDLLRKAPLPTGLNRRDAAFLSWEAAETQCYITNEFLQSLHTLRTGNPRADALVNYLRAVKKKMWGWMGPIPDELNGRFGPGTCFESDTSDPTAVDKIWLQPTTTPSALPLFRHDYDRTLWGITRWANRLGAPLPSSRGNRLTTVPKDGKTDRCICIEPLGNLWLQLAIGRLLKHRLKGLGLPDFSPEEKVLFPTWSFKLQDAQRVHRDILRSPRHGFATIDLSSASDTVSRELVRHVVPDDWYTLLDLVRSPLTLVNGEWRQLEKFSSMGNGFTFELESLIFCALLSVAFGLTPGVDLWVFGDDIILPEGLFHSACNLLDTFGFTVNRRKSFGSGPFRESCGANVHTGLDVTPVRIKAPLERPDELYAFHNALWARGASRKTLRLVRNLIPKRLQFAGPSWLGDIVLHGLPWRHLVKQRNHIYTIQRLRVDPKHVSLDRWSAEMAMVAAFFANSNGIIRRGTSVTFGAKRVSVS